MARTAGSAHARVTAGRRPAVFPRAQGEQPYHLRHVRRRCPAHDGHQDRRSARSQADSGGLPQQGSSKPRPVAPLKGVPLKGAPRSAGSGTACRPALGHGRRLRWRSHRLVEARSEILRLSSDLIKRLDQRLQGLSRGDRTHPSKRRTPTSPRTAVLPRPGSRSQTSALGRGDTGSTPKVATWRRNESGLTGTDRQSSSELVPKSRIISRNPEALRVLNDRIGELLVTHSAEQEDL